MCLCCNKLFEITSYSLSIKNLHIIFNNGLKGRGEIDGDREDGDCDEVICAG